MDEPLLGEHNHCVADNPLVTAAPAHGTKWQAFRAALQRDAAYRREVLMTVCCAGYLAIWLVLPYVSFEGTVCARILIIGTFAVLLRRFVASCCSREHMNLAFRQFRALTVSVSCLVVNVCDLVWALHYQTSNGWGFASTMIDTFAFSVTIFAYVSYDSATRSSRVVNACFMTFGFLLVLYNIYQTLFRFKDFPLIVAGQYYRLNLLTVQREGFIQIGALMAISLVAFTQDQQRMRFYMVTDAVPRSGVLQRGCSSLPRRRLRLLERVFAVLVAATCTMYTFVRGQAQNMSTGAQCLLVALCCTTVCTSAMLVRACFDGSTLRLLVRQVRVVLAIISLFGVFAMDMWAIHTGNFPFKKQQSPARWQLRTVLFVSASLTYQVCGIVIILMDGMVAVARWLQPLVTGAFVLVSGVNIYLTIWSWTPTVLVRYNGSYLLSNTVYRSAYLEVAFMLTLILYAALRDPEHKLFRSIHTFRARTCTAEPSTAHATNCNINHAESRASIVHNDRGLRLTRICAQSEPGDANRVLSVNNG